MDAPLAPSTCTDKRPLPVVMPPAATMGMPGNMADNAGTSTCNGLGPACPPAPCPTAIKPSQPASAHFLAWGMLVTSQNTLAPYAWACSITSFGLPSEVIKKGTFLAMQICRCLADKGLDLCTMMFTP